MSIIMTLRIALKALNRNKMRTILTMLGMIIGVGAVITMVALGTGARTTIEERVKSAGTNMIMVNAGNFSSGGVRMGQGNSTTMTPEDATMIKGIAGVSAFGNLLIDLNAPVAEADEPGAVLRDVHLVRDEDNRDAALPVELLEDVHDLAARARIEVSGRLVREDDRRLIDERSRDRNTLLLTARQLVRKVVKAVAKPDDLERLHGAAVALGPLHLRPTVVEQRQLDVVERRRPGQQVEALEHESDLLVAHDGELVLRHARDVLAVEEVFAAGGAVEAAEDVHQRRLAGSRRARDRHELAGLDVHVRAAQRADDHLADHVGLHQIANRNDRHVWL